jgi:hypothetical protein
MDKAEQIKSFEITIEELEKETIKSPLQYALMTALKAKVAKLKQNEIVKK